MPEDLDLVLGIAPSTLAVEPVVETPPVVTTTPPVVEVTPTPVELIRRVLVNVKAAEMAAKDLHYRAKGKAAYAIHELADLPWQAGRLTDELIETFYLGDSGFDAPPLRDIYLDACAVNLLGSKDDMYFISRLADACFLVIHAVEDAKKADLDTKAGVHAVLDEISKEFLVAYGLLKQTLKGPHKED